MIPNKKSSILLILKVLQEYTDEEHYLTQSQIAEKISHDYGIDIERKSVGSSISLLEELDYDIARGPKGGVALLSRTFDTTEASYIIDAIFASRSIDGKQAKTISNEVASCFSRYQRKDYSYIYKTTAVTRTSNQQTLYNVAIIYDAIKKGKQVGFNYLTYDGKGNKTTRKNNYEYIVSPYYLINNFGRYYLICNYREKYRPIQSFRIDYMINIHIREDWDIKPIESLSGMKEDFSISEYINSHIYMFNGDVVTAELEVFNCDDIAAIKDWFGESAKIRTKEDKIVASIKCDENALYYWIMQYSDCVKALSPSSLVERIKEGLNRAIEKYKD